MGNDNNKLILVGLGGLIAGLVLGLLYAYVLSPVVVIDTTPSSMRSDLRADYMRMVIDSYRVNGDAALAASRYALLEDFGPATLESIAPVTDPNVMSAFKLAIGGPTLPGATPAAEVPAANPETGTAKGLSTFTAVIVGVGVIGILAVLGGLVFYLFRGRTAGSEKSAAMQGIELNRQVQKTDYVAMGEEAPVAQYVTTYMLGDDLFDDSFSIDSPAGEFLGECGVGISETIGVGDPKKVTAFEVWIFDKNDIQTVTKVLMSPHAFKDPSLQSKLESKGELLELLPNKQIVLETATLQMVVSASTADFGQGPLPPESYYERLTLELAIWSKS
jgi:hypothetical protein